MKRLILLVVTLVFSVGTTVMAADIEIQDLKPNPTKEKLQIGLQVKL